MMTSSGPRCDLCGDFILPQERMDRFSVKGIEQELLCHTEPCGDDLVALLARGGPWQELPSGPLREAFEKAEGAVAV